MKPSFYLIFSLLGLSFFSCSKDLDENETIKPENPTGFLYSIIDGEASVVEMPAQESVEIPSSVEIKGELYPVTTIENNACNEAIKSLRLPESIKVLKPLAFAGMEVSIERLYIGSLQSWCNIEFQDTFYTVGAHDVYYSVANPIGPLTTLYVDEMPIEGELFVPDGIEAIPPYSFQYLNIESLRIGNSIEAIGKSAFQYCKNLKNLDLGENILEIDNEAFSNTDIREVKLPDSVKSLGGEIFSEATKIVYIPKSLERCGLVAFPGANEIHIGSLESWVNIDYYSALPYEGTPTPYLLPYNLFLEDVLLSHVDIPEGVEILHAYSFCFSQIESITLPKSIRLIESGVFYNCIRLSLINIEATIPPDLEYSSGLPVDIPIYVPAESIDAYLADPNWGRFSHIEPLP